MYKEKIRVVYIKKKIPVKGISNSWLLKNNKIKNILTKEYKIENLDYKKIKDNILSYLNNYGMRLKDKEIINNFLNENKFEIDKEILNKVNELKKNNAKVLHEGKYGTTLYYEDKVLKIQKIRHINEIKKYLREIFMCYYVNKKFGLAPKIHFCEFYSLNNLEKNILMTENEKIGGYLCDRNQYICGTYTMNKVEYIFCDLFDPEKMKEMYENKAKNKIILENFSLALKICIGNMELLMENDINHNDLHDGNFGFTKEGKFNFIDFGLSMLISDISESRYKNIINEYSMKYFDEDINEHLIIKKYLLLRELRYLKNMYYFDDDSVQLEELYNDNKYSPIKTTLELLKKDEYKFGYYKKFLNQKIDIIKVKRILEVE